MPKMLRPQDAAIMREALEYQAEPLDAEDFAVMLSNNISNPFSEEQQQAEQLLQKVCAFQADPASGLSLSDEDKAFIVHALRHLISICSEARKSEKCSKRISEHEKSIRQATVCVSRLA